MTWSYVSQEAVINCYEMGNPAQTSTWVNKPQNKQTIKQTV